MAGERAAAERQAAWEAYRQEERRRQQEEWARHQAALGARRRRVERGLGLEDLLGGGVGGFGGFGEGPVVGSAAAVGLGEEEEEGAEAEEAGYPYAASSRAVAAAAQRGWGWGGDTMQEVEEREAAEAQGLLPQESRAAIPFMITRDMRRTLVEDMNYSRKASAGGDAWGSWGGRGPCPWDRSGF